MVWPAWSAGTGATPDSPWHIKQSSRPSRGCVIAGAVAVGVVGVVGVVGAVGVDGVVGVAGAVLPQEMANKTSPRTTVTRRHQ
ncbi:hypothetical protein ACFLYX_01710 [Chloroflexota bacterium]